MRQPSAHNPAGVKPSLSPKCRNSCATHADPAPDSSAVEWLMYTATATR